MFLPIFKYRRYFNRRACLCSVCVLSVFCFTKKNRNRFGDYCLHSGTFYDRLQTTNKSWHIGQVIQMSGVPWIRIYPIFLSYIFLFYPISNPILFLMDKWNIMRQIYSFKMIYLKWITQVISLVLVRAECVRCPWLLA